MPYTVVVRVGWPLQIKKGGQMAADQVEHLDVNKVLTQACFL